jgi:hypothetical protein
MRPRLQDWTHLLTDPDRKELKRMIQVGESVSWPKVRSLVIKTCNRCKLKSYSHAQLHMIENRLKIEVREKHLGRRIQSFWSLTRTNT